MNAIIAKFLNLINFMNRKRKFILIKIIIIFFIIFSFLAQYFLYHKFCLETRYAFDFGSGAIKSKAVEFDVCINKTHKVFGQFDKPIKFINCLKLDDNRVYFIDEKCLNRATIEFNNFEEEYNISCKKSKCAGVATAWARKASNVKTIIDALAKQGVQMKILSQHDEGIYAFNAVIKSGEIDNIDSKDVIVWDIGGGSFQLSMLDENNKVYVYHGAHGIESFEKEIRNVLHNNLYNHSPFFSNEALKIAMNYAYEKYGHPILQDKVILKKFKDNPKVKIYAIGGPMTKGLKKQMYVPKTATLENLYKTAKIFEDRSEGDVYWNSFPELPIHYVKSAQISLILIHGIMKGIGVNQINILDTSISDYVMYEKELWHQ